MKAGNGLSGGEKQRIAPGTRRFPAQKDSNLYLLDEFHQ